MTILALAELHQLTRRRIEPSSTDATADDLIAVLASLSDGDLRCAQQSLAEYLNEWGPQGTGAYSPTRCLLYALIELGLVPETTTTTA